MAADDQIKRMRQMLANHVDQARFAICVCGTFAPILEYVCMQECVFICVYERERVREREKERERSTTIKRKRKTESNREIESEIDMERRGDK